MTQQFEDFVNAALDKSLASDVTLPTANKILYIQELVVK